MKPGTPLVIPVIIWISGIIFQHHLNITFSYLIPLTGISLISALLLRKQRLALVLTAIFFTAALRTALDDITPSGHLQQLFTNRASFTQPLTGRIRNAVNSRSDRSVFELEVLQIKNVPVKGNLLYYSDNDSLKHGDIIEVIALISAPGRSTNPNSFDFGEYLQYRGINGFAYAKTPDKVVDYKPVFLEKLINSCRDFLVSEISSRFHSNAGFIRAVLLGDKSGIEDKKTEIQQAGLSHLLAVSGLHVGIISITFLAFLKLIIPNRTISRILLIIILLFYAALCRWAPSVTRATLMISLYLLARIIQRRPQATNILFLSLLIITSVKPDQLFAPGFQLSYIAVFVLLNILPLLLSKFKAIFAFIKCKLIIKILSYLLLIPLSSLVLILFLSPVIAVHFHQFNLNGIIGNLLAIPLISLLLPLSLLVLILPQPLSGLFLNSFKLIMLVFDHWVVLSSSLSWKWNFVTLTTSQIFLIYSILFCNIRIILRKPYRKYITAFLMICLIILGISLVDGKRDFTRITFFDCGLGDLILVETPEGETVMVDCGPGEQDGGHIRYSALPYLQNEGIGSIDWLLITHAHLDHYGGAEFLFENLLIKNLIVTDDFTTRKVWEDIGIMVENEDCQLILVEDTTSVPLVSQKLKIMHPARDFHHQNINNMSLVCRLDLDDLSILLTGDLEEEGEEHLITHYPELLDCDILKIGHHGSKTSSSTEFIEHVSPELACISTSLQNRFNFPHQITLEKYLFLQDKLYITGRDGALILESNGRDVFVISVLRSDELYWKLK